jgi:branched-chain amino acid transport system ATP-binding protein
MLRVEHLQVAHGDLQVVWDVSFEVPPRSIVAIIGPNGAGKSTTMRAVMSLLPTMGGDVSFDGRSIVGMPTHGIVEAGLVMVPEEKATFSGLTVQDNLELGAFPRRVRARRSETMEKVYSLFPRLSERRSQLAGTLSGGERQMLAIGKALMAQPEMLVLDEPSLGLAPIIVEDIFRIITEIRSSGVPVLLVEQHVEMTLEVADRAYILEQGRIVGDGTSAELLADQRVRDAYLSI